MYRRALSALTLDYRGSEHGSVVEPTDAGQKIIDLGLCGRCQPARGLALGVAAMAPRFIITYLRTASPTPCCCS